MIFDEIKKGENKRLELKEKLPSNEKISRTVITELQRQRFNKSFDEEENFEFEFETLNLNIIYNEFKKINKPCNYEKSKNLKLIKDINGKNLPTNALLIALGSFDNTQIKCARFRGVTKEIFIDKKEFNDDLFSNLENSIKFLQNHLNLNAEVVGLQLQEELEIPLLALREALINAIIHRNYLRNSDIKVAVYDDIIEITSPGGFPNGLILEEVMSGRSEIRNKILANLFRELKYVETWGSGITKIKKLCKNKNIEFEINESSNFVNIVFHRPHKIPNSTEKMPNSTEKLLKLYTNEQEEKIITFIIKNKKINVDEVEELLNLKERRAREILSNLVKKDILEKIGKTKGSYYILNETKRLIQ